MRIFVNRVVRFGAICGALLLILSVSSGDRTAWVVASARTLGVGDKVLPGLPVLSTSATANFGGGAAFQAAAVSCTANCTIFNNVVQPTGTDFSDSLAVELGVKFQSDQPGYITALRFFKTAGNTGTHTGRLWNANGTVLAAAVFASETAAGWQTVTLDPAVHIDANALYIASYHTDTGTYLAASNFFAKYHRNRSVLMDHNDVASAIPATPRAGADRRY